MKKSVIRYLCVIMIGLAWVVDTSVADDVSSDSINGTTQGIMSVVPETFDISPTSQAADSDKLSFTLTAYAWFTGISGDIGAGGQQASVDESAADIVSAVDTVTGVFGRADIRFDRFGFYVDGGYMRMGIENQSTKLGPTEITSELSVVDFAILYRAIEWPADGTTPGISVDALAGGRYFHLGNDLNIELVGSKDQIMEWVDPIIGAEAALDFSEHWRLQFHGDVGGFGAGSRLTWSGVGQIAYAFHINKSIESTVFVGYKALGENYTSGSGSNKFVFDAILNGPIIGVNITF
jgi:hypothetical protein